MPNHPEPIDPDVDLHVPAQRTEVSARLIALISLGGGLGGLARHGLSTVAPGPFGIFVINVAGSFLIGALMARTPKPPVRAFLGVGVLGGFTTFSAYSLAPLWSLALTPVCAYLGVWAGRWTR